jgi:hypothetical protein
VLAALLLDERLSTQGVPGIVLTTLALARRWLTGRASAVTTQEEVTDNRSVPKAHNPQGF